MVDTFQCQLLELRVLHKQNFEGAVLYCGMHVAVLGVANHGSQWPNKPDVYCGGYSTTMRATYIAQGSH